MKRKLAAAALVLLVVLLLPAQQKRIYIANDDHTDYLWAADANTYRDAFLAMLDYYLDQAEATAGDPEPYRNRFNVDGTFWIRTYENNRSPAEFDRLILRIKDGSIGVPLTLLNLCYGAMPAEAVLRSMYYAGRLERRYGLRLRLALSQENQTFPSAWERFSREPARPFSGKASAAAPRASPTPGTGRSTCIGGPGWTGAGS